MRAIRMTAPRTMELVELPDPKRGAGEVLVRITEVALCGSDLITYMSTRGNLEFPIKDGKPIHECVGEVLESEMEGFAEGDRVLYFPPGQDGLRELAVASNPTQILKLPDEGDISIWMMAQLLGTVMHAARMLGDVMSERCAVVGQGPVGQFWNHLLWNLGARSVIGIDKIPERLEVSPKMHATHTLQVGRDDVATIARELTGGAGPDLVIEASGYEETLNLTFDIVKRDGRVMMFGAPKHWDQNFRLANIYEKRLHVMSTTGPEVERDIHVALEYIQQGRIDPSPILTHRFPLEKAQEAYEMYAERQQGCVKVVLVLA